MVHTACALYSKSKEQTEIEVVIHWESSSELLNAANGCQISKWIIQTSSVDEQIHWKDLIQKSDWFIHKSDKIISLFNSRSTKSRFSINNLHFKQIYNGFRRHEI